jgi:hypothetical protein
MEHYELSGDQILAGGAETGAVQGQWTERAGVQGTHIADTGVVFTINANGKIKNYVTAAMKLLSTNTRILIKGKGTAINKATPVTNQGNIVTKQGNHSN